MRECTHVCVGGRLCGDLVHNITKHQRKNVFTIRIDSKTLTVTLGRSSLISRHEIDDELYISYLHGKGIIPTLSHKTKLPCTTPYPDKINNVKLNI